MEERRRFVRLGARVEVACTVLPSGTSQQAQASDVGWGGCCLVTEQPIPPGTQLQVALALPGREQPVNALAEVAWNEPQELIGKMDRRRSAANGVRYVEIAPGDQEAITAFIAGRLRAAGS